MLKYLTIFVSLFMLIGCSDSKMSVEEQRAEIKKMEEGVLADLYKEKASVRQEIAAAPGYAVFSNVGVNIIFASVGGGYGVAHASSGKTTYMKMGEVGLGLGLGVKDFRAVFVFHNKEAFTQFVEKGWAFGAEADAAAKADDKGGAASAEGTFNGATVYQLTETGLALQATLKGTKYWKDDELNK